MFRLLPEVHPDGVGAQEGVIHGSQQLLVVALVWGQMRHFHISVSAETKNGETVRTKRLPAAVHICVKGHQRGQLPAAGHGGAELAHRGAVLMKLALPT